MNGVDKLIGIITEAWGIPSEQVATDDDRRSLIRIAADLDALYRDDDVVRSFIDKSIEQLGGASPKAAIAAGKIANVESYVAFLSGR
jgi:hypothetical protein